MASQIQVILSVDDDDADPDDSTGLTAAAHDRLMALLAQGGFGVVDGPTAVEVADR